MCSTAAAYSSMHAPYRQSHNSKALAHGGKSDYRSSSSGGGGNWNWSVEVVGRLQQAVAQLVSTQLPAWRLIIVGAAQSVQQHRPRL